MTLKDLSQKKDEESLKEIDEKYRALYDNAMVALFRVSLKDQKAIAANKVSAELFGYSSTEEFIEEFRSLKHYANPEDRELIIQELKAKGYIDKIVMRSKKKDGTLIWNEASFRLNPEKCYVDCVSIDITERKQAEDVLKASRDYLENLTNSMWDAVFSVKMPERVIEWVNDSFRLIGYEPSECIGKDTAFLYADKDDFLDFGKKLKDAMAAGKNVLHSDQLLKRKSGETFPAEITVTFHRVNNEVVSVTSIVRDITERKQAESELQERMNELKTFYRITLGREERVIELKQEVNQLLEQLGKNKKYRDYS